MAGMRGELAATDYQRYFARSLAAVMMRTDRVLLNRGDVEVNATWQDEEGGASVPAPGWSLGHKIWFDPSRFHQDLTTQEGTTVALAVNYHEAAHVQFTPEKPELALGAAWDAARQRYSIEFAAMVWNIMEDSRIERLWLATFPATRPFFELMMATEVVDIDGKIRKFIRDNQSVQGIAHSPHGQKADAAVGKYLYPLIAGRRYLDAELLNGVRELSSMENGPAFVDQVDAIMRQYLSITYRRAALNTSGADLFTRMCLLLWDQMDSWERGLSSDMRKGHTTCGAGDPSAQAKAQGKAAQVESKGGQPVTGKTTPAKGDQGDSDDSGASSGGSDQDDDSGQGDQGSADGQNGQSDDDWDQPAHGASRDDHNRWRMPDVIQRAKDLADEVFADTKIRSEVSQVIERTTLGQYNRNAIGSLIARPGLPVSPEWLVAKNSMVKTWRRVSSKHDPGWERELSSGRFNTNRYMADRMSDTPTDFSMAFDQWNPGNEHATSLQVFMLADISGSMRNQMGNLGVAMWAARRSLHELEIPVETILFGDRSWNLNWGRFPATMEADVLPVSNSTVPMDGLRQAYAGLRTSKRRHKVLCVLSDGAWMDDAEENNLIRQMNKEGMHTAMAFVSSYGRNNHADMRKNYGHDCKVFRVINNAGDFAFLVRDIVTGIIKGR